MFRVRLLITIIIIAITITIVTVIVTVTVIIVGIVIVIIIVVIVVTIIVVIVIIVISRSNHLPLLVAVKSDRHDRHVRGLRQRDRLRKAGPALVARGVHAGGEGHVFEGGAEPVQDADLERGRAGHAVTCEAGEVIAGEPDELTVKAGL